ncbi:voltage-gated chloride channel family protein [Chitinophagaceae bacterium MMS25-I14]
MIRTMLQQRLRRQLHFRFIIRWLLISLLVGSLAGSASAVFLIALNRVTDWRELHPYILWALPVGGVLVAALYHYFGRDVVKGNNQLLEEIEKPKNIIPLKMAPLVLIGTLLTHLFGGSAGREGTAVQMGGAIADQFTRLFRLNKHDRRLLIVCGISAGFASVFGTPLAGTVFALEVLVIGRMSYEALIPSLLSALVANYVCELWPVQHTHYTIGIIPGLGPLPLLYAILAGILFGLTSLSFSLGMDWTGNIFKKLVKNPLLRAAAGGAIVLACVMLSGTTKYIGLGVPTIVESFSIQQPFYAFAIKIFLTVVTLSCGFKGGEVTPLFFIGATLGSALSLVMPLPVGLLAGMGFVAVFAGAANTPVACVLMGIELFGAECGVYIAIACFMAYVFSGHTGIYRSQTVGSPKHPLLVRQRAKKLDELDE